MTNREAIERIKDHMHVHKIGEYPHIYIAEALNLAVSALESAPVWTPCSEGMPEAEPYYAKAEKLYLVNYTWGDDTIRTAIASYREVRHHELKDTVWYDEVRKEDMIQNMSGSGRLVLAWQHLPESYNPNQFRDTTKKVIEQPQGGKGISDATTNLRTERRGKRIR